MRGSTAATFAEARTAFKAAWQDYLPRCTKADFQTWRDHQAWTVEKYLRLDHGEKVPTDYQPHDANSEANGAPVINHYHRE